MMKSKNWVAKLYFLLILLIPVIPQSNTMDVVGLQWFAFSVINIIVVLTIIPKINLLNSLGITAKLWGLFMIIITVSSAYSINFTLALQDLSRWCQVIIGIGILTYFFRDKQISFNYISNSILTVLLIETVYILIPLFLNIYLNGFENEGQAILSPGLFNGLTGNKNIAAASIMVKLPFVLYHLKSLKPINALLSIIIVVFAILSVLFIAARASYISLLFTTLLFILGGIFYVNGPLNKKIIYLFTTLIMAYVIGFSLGNKFIPSGSATSLTKKVESISFTRSGSSGRTLLWSDALSFISDHPVLGGGIGSWKIESAPYWNIHGAQYLVPYHAHNDFLEITAEIGIVGGVLYISLFIRIFYLMISRLRQPKSKESLFYLVCLFSLIAYVVDASLNFPMERYIMQIMLCILFAAGMINENKIEK